MFKKLKNKKGFTLIEIIVVIVILAVLMAVAVPSVMSYMNEGKNAKFQTVGRAVLIDTQTQYAKAVANGASAETAKNSIIAYVKDKTYTGLEKAGDVQVTKIDLSGKDTDDAAERDIEKVECSVKIDNDTKTVTVDTNKNVTVK